MGNAVEIIGRLVGFDTVSHKSNLDLVSWVQELLAGSGVQSVLVPNEDGTKANLFATVGPMTGGGVVLSGHTDVVPVEGQDWSSDPFTLREMDQRLYGRGTCDMKGFVGTVLSKIPEMVNAGLRRPIHVALSHDEETGCLGAPHLIREMQKRLPEWRAVIVGEPTEMKAVEGHKGMITGRIEISGLEAHSSIPQTGVSATDSATELLQQIAAFREKLVGSARLETGFEPAYSTINIATVNGGTAANIVAGRCHIGWSLRVMPDDDAAEILNELNRLVSDLNAKLQLCDERCGAVFHVDTDIPSFGGTQMEPAAEFCRSLTGENQARNVVSYATEAGHFQRAGAPTVVCGPGTIEQAHKPDEFIERSQIEACEKFIGRLISVQAS